MRRGLACFAVLLGSLALASPAAADHHLVKIREYYPGQQAQPNDGFLELQMYAAGTTCSAVTRSASTTRPARHPSPRCSY